MHKIISENLLIELTQKASALPRKRLNFNYHEVLSDPINRMLNACEPGTYTQPHKHENPDKREVFLILKGSLVVVIFDTTGNPLEFILLNHQKGNHGVEIPQGTWHTIFSIESGTVAYEIKDGPYIQISDKNFAPWAPKEGHQDCAEYLRNLTSQYYSNRFKVV